MKILFLNVLLAISLQSCYVFVKRPSVTSDASQDKEYLDSIKEYAKQSYWLVIRGYHSTDNLVAGATLSDYSHAVILDKKNNEIIESTSEGVHSLGLKEFVNKSHRITIVKPYGYTQQRADSAINIARSKIGEPYDFLGTVGLNSKDKYYCSELAVFCYPYLRDSLKMPLIIEPRDLLKFGEVVFESKVRAEK